MIDLDEFQRRVDQYFQCGQKSEPQGRIILDMMRALREAHAEINTVRNTAKSNLKVAQDLLRASKADNERAMTKQAENETLRAENERLTALVILGDQAIAENERLCLQREGLLCRVAELRAEIELVSK